MTDSEVLVLFEWDKPQGSGPQAIVDYYTITISPSPLYPSNVTVLPSTSLALNVTLGYNILYRATISAENCAGESEIFVFPRLIEYSMLQIFSVNFSLTDYTLQLTVVTPQVLLMGPLVLLSTPERGPVCSLCVTRDFDLQFLLLLSVRVLVCGTHHQRI